MLSSDPMWEQAAVVELPAADRAALESLVRAGSTPQKVAARAAIILGAAGGQSNRQLAKALRTSRPTVILWRRRYAEAGIPGLLRDAPRPGRRRRLSAKRVERIVEATLHTTPRAATHWSVRAMARAQGVSPKTVHRIWQAHGLQPHRTESFKAQPRPGVRRQAARHRRALPEPARQGLGPVRR
jgi:transposase